MHVGDRGGVDEVLARRAVLVVVVVLPVLHEEADDLVALLLQQPRGDRRVDAARHADDDALLLMSKHDAVRVDRRARAGKRCAREVVVDALHDQRAAMPRASGARISSAVSQSVRRMPSSSAPAGLRLAGLADEGEAHVGDRLGVLADRERVM